VASKWTQQPYSPLELEGRDIYVAEGCYNCHSQMIRPFRAETLRYGEYSRLEEFIYDRPFQWGSKRTGPDLHREGGKYPHLWHYQHLMDPRSTSPGSNMPSYAWMKTSHLDLSRTAKKLQVMRTLGVPYADAEITAASELAREQARRIQGELARENVRIEPETRTIALIAYLQRLGRGVQLTAATATGGR
jgi:cytochrome c oxidase cbb3-type subunit I/II